MLNEDYIEINSPFINILGYNGSIVEPLYPTKEEPVYLNYTDIVKIFTRSIQPKAQKHSEIILFSYNLIMGLHSKEKVLSLENELHNINTELKETRIELSSKLDESNKKLDEIRSQKDEVMKELSDIKIQNKELSMKVDQLRRCNQNNISEITRGNNTLTSASSQLTKLAVQVTQPSSIKEPNNKKLVDTLIILRHNNSYVYGCRQSRSISTFKKQYSEYEQFAIYTNVNNSKYCMCFLENSNIILDKQIRTFTSELTPEELKRTLDNYINKFKKITENTESVQRTINNARNILKISTEDNTEY